jgi:hypothetical protein
LEGEDREAIVAGATEHFQNLSHRHNGIQADNRGSHDLISSHGVQPVKQVINNSNEHSHKGKNLEVMILGNISASQKKMRIWGSQQN